MNSTSKTPTEAKTCLDLSDRQDYMVMSCPLFRAQTLIRGYSKVLNISSEEGMNYKNTVLGE